MSANTGKRYEITEVSGFLEIKCTSCQVSLNPPFGYSGWINAPSCDPYDRPVRFYAMIGIKGLGSFEKLNPCSFPLW